MRALGAVAFAAIIVVACAQGTVVSGAQTPPAPPASPQRILLVGDSTAETMYPYLRDAAAARGIRVFSAARVGCGVIDGQPVLDDGRPYVDVVGDTRRCAGTTEPAQREILDSRHPDLIVWLSGWESWPNRVLDGNLVYFGTIAGNQAILGHIDAAVNRFITAGARLVFLPVAPNAYPSVRGYPDPAAGPRLAELAKMLRTYTRAHADKVSLIDLPAILCPNGEPCPEEIQPGIKPREVDGFHFVGPGAAWLADQLVGMLMGTTPPPASPAVPGQVNASVGSR
jgi:hypothetical protein